MSLYRGLSALYSVGASCALGCLKFPGRFSKLLSKRPGPNGDWPSGFCDSSTVPASHCGESEDGNSGLPPALAPRAWGWSSCQAAGKEALSVCGCCGSPQSREDLAQNRRGGLPPTHHVASGRGPHLCSGFLITKWE